MAEKSAEAGNEHFPESEQGNYQVVARRFRPQLFSELVGQEQVAKALKNAIDRSRVGHAYLFTGARGVGKTSTARIFAKCLNCVEGPTDSPCGACDVCAGVAEGEDVDVIEIDGASNRGIEEIRQLRANVNVRPSRARFKIYIIDEVHMLTMAAFNALLKTLEEPPAHVKFFFCTTDPEKIPITVLSRCQRFDLPPISMEQIKQRLGFIAQQDGVQVDDEALDILARRANGSMRDSQSLLDQLFSFCTERITAADVHSLLGTADSRQVLEILQACINRETTNAIVLLGDAINGGVDPGQLNEQLLSLFRDMMTLRVGCSPDQLLFCNSADVDALQTLADANQLEQILASIEVLDTALTRMRQSTHSRTLLETAVVRICSLPDLQSMANLIEQLRTGQPLSVQSSVASAKVTGSQTTKTAASSGVKPKPVKSPAKKKTEIESVQGSKAAVEMSARQVDSKPSTAPAESNVQLSDSDCEGIWKSVLTQIDDLTSDLASNYESFVIDGDRMVVTMQDAYHRDACERAERKQRLELAINHVTGRNIRIDFQASTKTLAKATVKKPRESRIQKIRKYEQEPFVKKVIELFDAEITDVVDPPNG